MNKFLQEKVDEIWLPPIRWHNILLQKNDILVIMYMLYHVFNHYEYTIYSRAKTIRISYW